MTNVVVPIRIGSSCSGKVTYENILPLNGNFYSYFRFDCNLWTVSVLWHVGIESGKTEICLTVYEGGRNFVALRSSDIEEGKEEIVISSVMKHVADGRMRTIKDTYGIF